MTVMGENTEPVKLAHGEPTKKKRPRRTSFGTAGKRMDLGEEGKGVFVRSKWEANIYRILNRLVQDGDVESFIYEPPDYEFPVKRGITFYKADFQVKWANGNVEVWEIKGYMDKASKTKLNRMKKYHPNVNVKMIGRSAYLHLQNLYASIIQNWE